MAIKSTKACPLIIIPTHSMSSSDTTLNIIIATPFSKQSFLPLTCHMELTFEVDTHLAHDSIHSMLHRKQIVLQL